MFNGLKSIIFQDQKEKDGDARRRIAEETGGSGKKSQERWNWSNPWIHLSGKY